MQAPDCVAVTHLRNAQRQSETKPPCRLTWHALMFIYIYGVSLVVNRVASLGNKERAGVTHKLRAIILHSPRLDGDNARRRAGFGFSLF
jgi:hypothetical protein